MSDRQILSGYSTRIPSSRALPVIFWESYSEQQKILGFRLSLLLWIASGHKLLPREFQLQATLALLSGKDVLVDVGTGYGKTLCMILPCLLNPELLAMIISPLKRLQALQILEFQRYGIKTVSINEDTPNDSALWKDISDGKYTALLVQPEQLSMFNGHLPRLARLIDRNRSFTHRIRQLHVDEAHFIVTAGQPRYGLSAFRPAWARLGELRVKLGKQLVVQALSGTQPDHIKQAIAETLQLDGSTLCSIKLSSNRPNIVYATHPIVGGLSDFRNLDFLIPENYPDDFQLPKTLVFHDSREEAAKAANYLKEKLPNHLCSKGLVKHYHGLMSKSYLTQTFDDFASPAGRFLTNTVIFQGLDVLDIEVVIQYGITRDVPTTLQRGGRGGRNSSSHAIFLILYEPWVLDINTSSLLDLSLIDPDYPNAGKLDKSSSKVARTGIAMIRMVQSTDCCIRTMWADYLGDKTPSALLFTAQYCCDRHTENGFDLRNFFKGRLLHRDSCTQEVYYSDPNNFSLRHSAGPQRQDKRKASTPIRPKVDRESLISHLRAWRYETHQNDHFKAIRPPSFFLDDKRLHRLAKFLPNEIVDAPHLTTILDETQEWQDTWGMDILGVIRNFDRRLAGLRRIEATLALGRQKKARKDEDNASFAAASKETEDRIVREVTQRLRSGNTRQILQNCENTMRAP
ncbi:P-loop containing nucleoside triphosphate hydrolase protein [Crepidotus variabilis]|uniref:DNA 3'-5' helicase n=1 Tax=Crepidotus variabilis TaxID=179855 RepID=A0A9P6EA66_9AGAR|nr:P-loop containing nucleoside triphosphate hydrolase protein [Crepidotus variabilis]